MEVIDPLLKVDDVAEVANVSVPTVYRRVADGTFPKPVKIGGLARWPKSEILEAIEKAKARRYPERGAA
jgi:excisionase family DNA binding protein